MFAESIKNLVSEYQLAQSQTVKGLFSKGLKETAAGILYSGDQPVAFHVDNYHEFKASAVIWEHRLGIIGMVYQFEASDDLELKQSEAIANWVRYCADEAAFLHDLLFQHRTSGDSENKAPIGVEVVLAIDTASPEIGEQLKFLLRSTNQLSSIGLHLWDYKNGEQGRRKAFCWLLKHSRDWMKSFGGAEEIKESKFPLSKLSMRDYRRPGNRSWSPQPNANLQIIHGHNGTGKSSITEVAELLLTGGIKRIKSNLLETVTYQPLQGEHDLSKQAKIQYQANGDDALQPFNWDNPVTENNDSLVGDGIRFNEQFGHRLIHQGAEQRAKLILEAFFPEENEAIQAALDAANTEREALEEIPAEIRQQISQAADTSPEELLPITSEGDSFFLLQFIKGLESGEWWEIPTWDFFLEAPGQLLNLESQLKRLCDDRTQLGKDCVKAIEALQQLEKWRPQSKSSKNQLDKEKILRDYQELVAVEDILKQLSILSQVRSALIDEDYPYTYQNATQLIAEVAKQTPDNEEIQTIVDSLEGERERLEKEFKIATQVSGESGEKIDQLDLVQIEALNRIGDWLALPLLGDSIAKAIAQDEVVIFFPSECQYWLDRFKGDGLTIGFDSWNAPMIEAISQFKDYLNRSVINENRISISENKDSIKTLLNARRRIKKSDREALGKFTERIAGNDSLRYAFNEILDTMNPARWAYCEVFTEFSESNQSEVDFKVNNRDAEQVFNTAELNLLALALFILLGPTLNQNKWRTLWLDDPFQNMDELTIQSVIRVIARILRLWQINGIDWYLVILLHSEVAAKTLHAEAYSFLYEIPWLTPNGLESEANEISLDEVSCGAGKQFQNLAQLIS